MQLPGLFHIVRPAAGGCLPLCDARGASRAIEVGWGKIASHGRTQFTLANLQCDFEGRPYQNLHAINRNHR
jgi:hypothetical protein